MFYNELLNRKKELENISQLITLNIQNAPEGKLRISKKEYQDQYYLINQKGDTTGTYLHHNNSELINALAQKSYEEKLLKEITSQIKALDTFISHYDPSKLGALYDSLNQSRKSLVIPHFLSDSEYIRRWENEPYIGNPIFPEELQHETDRGEYVRTKSEKTIANIYHEMGIPYKYEAPFTLFNGQIVYPDFTLLNIKTRKLIYHEHLGMLEDEKYRKKNLIKMSDYNKSGIILGNNFFITYETDYCPLNDKQIRKAIQAIFND